MSTKIILIVSGVVVLTAGGVIAARNMGRLTSYQLRDPQQGNVREVPPKQTLHWYAEQTKARGENEITLNAPFIDYPGNSMSTHADDALASFSGVVAEPIQQEVVTTDNGGILTWYKFEIIETLSKHNPYECDGCATPPADFLPINENQFAMAKYGGTVTVDGVKMTMFDPTFPQLELNKRYFLFISRASSGLATIGVGPNGVFEVEPNGSMDPINRNPHSIKDDIKQRFGKSLNRFREHSRRVSN